MLDKAPILLAPNLREESTPILFYPPIKSGVPLSKLRPNIFGSTSPQISVRVIFYSRNENDYQIEPAPLIENDYRSLLRMVID